MDQSPILLFTVSVGVLLLLLFVFFFIYTRKLKSNLHAYYQQQIEDQKLSLQTHMQTLMEQYKGDLKAETDQKTLEAKKELEQNLQEYKSELKSFVQYELELLKSKIKNLQPSYPKKLEAQQKLAVLIDSILPRDSDGRSNSADTLPVLSQSFENGHRSLKQFVLDYAGIIGDQTEEILSACAVYCAEGIAETNPDGSLTNRGEKLVQDLVNNLLLAKKSLKKDFAPAK